MSQVSLNKVSGSRLVEKITHADNNTNVLNSLRNSGHFLKSVYDPLKNKTFLVTIFWNRIHLLCIDRPFVGIKMLLSFTEFKNIVSVLSKTVLDRVTKELWNSRMTHATVDRHGYR